MEVAAFGTVTSAAVGENLAGCDDAAEISIQWDANGAFC